MIRYDYFKPHSLEEARRLFESHPDALFIAGGTDIMVQIRTKRISPPALISLSNIPELSGMIEEDEVRIGAMTTIADCLRHPLLRERYPIIAEAARRLGSTQIRNVATLGGNICNASPAADMAPPLLLLDAYLSLWRAGESREVSLDAFFTGPGKTVLRKGEILREIILPPLEQQALAVLFKKSRTGVDLSMASVAALLVMNGNICEHARIAAGAVAPHPLRLKKVEAHLEGRPLTGKTIEKAVMIAEKSISPVTDIRSSAEHRRRIFSIYLRRELVLIAGGAS